MLGLKKCCLVPINKASLLLKTVAVVFHPLELGRSAKNQQFDDTIILGQGPSCREWIGPHGLGPSER